MNIDPARLAAAIATVAGMTRTEFYTACEAVGLEIHEDHNMPTPRHPIALRQRDAFWANRTRQEQHQ